jgi:hypothetical protein
MIHWLISIVTRQIRLFSSVWTLPITRRLLLIEALPSNPHSSEDILRRFSTHAVPNDPNHDSFLGSELVGGIGIVNDGLVYLISHDPLSIGLAAKAFDILFMKFWFL